MKDFLKPREQLLEELGSDPQTGLTGAQAEESRARHGANVLTRQKQDPCGSESPRPPPSR